MEGAIDWDSVYSAATSWTDLKIIIKRFVGYRSDALHVVTGLAILFGAALALRRSVADWLPHIILLVFAVANEAVDILVGGASQYGESAKDMVVTLLVPMILLTTTRRLPRLYEWQEVQRRTQLSSDDSEPEDGV